MIQQAFPALLRSVPVELDYIDRAREAVTEKVVLAQTDSHPSPTPNPHTTPFGALCLQMFPVLCRPVCRRHCRGRHPQGRGRAGAVHRRHCNVTRHLFYSCVGRAGNPFGSDGEPHCQPHHCAHGALCVRWPSCLDSRCTALPAGPTRTRQPRPS